MSLLRYFLAAVFVSSCSIAVHAQVKLPRLISDGMVLQRNSEVKICGWASKEEPISIFFNGQEYSTKADSNGNWSISLSQLEQGGPYTMEIKASNTISLKDVYIWDVWLASGQSNMELSMGRVEPLYPEEIANAANTELRFFEVPKTYSESDTDSKRNRVDQCHGQGPDRQVQRQKCECFHSL